jgi:16S rRNA (guanine966-N2)-methyltransferase
MSDKVRGALFSSLGDIEGYTVLDAFAGSGALGLEAISRGASQVVAVEIEKTAHKTIQDNARELATKNLRAIRANVSGWSDNNPLAQFDLVFCDPPYDNLQLNLLQKLVRHLKPSGLYVLSWPGKLDVPEFAGLKLVKSKRYGDAQLAFYRNFS